MTNSSAAGEERGVPTGPVEQRTQADGQHDRDRSRRPYGAHFGSRAPTRPTSLATGVPAGAVRERSMRGSCRELLPAGDDDPGDRVDDQGDHEQEQAGRDQRRDGHRGPPASPNFSAMVDAKVSPPGSVMCQLILKPELSTSATAMVSPSARPRPEHRRGDDPGPAERQHGGADHLPLGARRAPRRRRWSPRGTCRKTSRQTADTIGMIMIASTMPAISRDLPNWLAVVAVWLLKIGIQPKYVGQPHLEALGVRDQEVQAPHAEHQRRHRGQQVDDRAERGRRPPGRVVRDEQRDRRSRSGTPMTIAMNDDDHGAEEHRRHAEDRRVALRIPGLGGEDVPGCCSVNAGIAFQIRKIGDRGHHHQQQAAGPGGQTLEHPVAEPDRAAGDPALGRPAVRGRPAAWTCRRPPASGSDRPIGMAARPGPSRRAPVRIGLVTRRSSDRYRR